MSRQKGAEDCARFEAWAASMTNEDFAQIVRRGILNRTEMAKQVGIGTSALRQNPGIKSALQALEDKLREEEVLPKLTYESEDAKSSRQTKQHDQNERQRRLDQGRIAELEKSVVDLTARSQALEKQLERFGELSEVLSEFGIMPGEEVIELRAKVEELEAQLSRYVEAYGELAYA